MAQFARYRRRDLRNALARNVKPHQSTVSTQYAESRHHPDQIAELFAAPETRCVPGCAVPLAPDAWPNPFAD
jgi:hypothetical protein